MTDHHRLLSFIAVALLLAVPASAQVRLGRLPKPDKAAIAALPVAPAPPAAAPLASVCAALPTSGSIGVAAADDEAPARPTADRNWRCDPDFRLDLTGRLPVCRRPGVKAVDGDPRAACYAALPLGPLAAVGPRDRPTRSCPVTSIASIVRLDGANAGVSDAALTASPPAGVTLMTLSATGAGVPPAGVPPAEDPVVQGCFAFACRLVRVAIAAPAADRVTLRLALPGREPVEVPVALRTWCPH